MKRILFIAALFAACLLLSIESQGRASKSRIPLSSPTRELMREKLAHSQNILEGIATEDYGKIAQQGRKLRAISQQPNWPSMDHPIYVRYVEMFQHNVDYLINAADEKNLDSVSLGYVKVTISCVDCHKVARGKKTAATDYGNGVAIAKIKKISDRNGGAP